MGTSGKRNPAGFYAKDRQEWRGWLEKNHAKEKSVWLILYHADSVTPGVSYSDAVEEAICFKPEKRDGESSLLLFSQRKPGSKWSRINRHRAER